MNGRQTRVFASIDKSVSTLNMRELKIPALATLTGDLQKNLDEIRATFRVQFSGRRSAGADGRTIAALRKEVQARLARISSHSISKLKGLPGIREDVGLPLRKAKNDVLLEATERIIKNVRPHLKTLYKTGLPKDSIRALEKAASQLAAKKDNPDTEIARRSRATQALPDLLKEGRELIKAIDDAIKIEFVGTEPIITVWKNAKRIPGKVGRPKKRRGSQPPDEKQS